MNNRPVFLPRVTSEPRTVVLHRSRKGFGFVLRGAKATSPLMELTPSARYPALQYLDDVDQGGVADLAGLRKGDYLIQVSFLPIHIYPCFECFSRYLVSTDQRRGRDHGFARARGRPDTKIGGVGANDGGLAGDQPSELAIGSPSAN